MCNFWLGSREELEESRGWVVERNWRRVELG